MGLEFRYTLYIYIYISVITEKLDLTTMHHKKSEGWYQAFVFLLPHGKQPNKRCKSLWKNVESHSSTILEDEKLNSFLLERAWQVLQKTIF